MLRERTTAPRWQDPRSERLGSRPSAVLVKVEFFFWRGCPSHPEALELLEDVLRGCAEIQLREVRTQAEAEALSFPGSPTIRIDGRDVDSSGAHARPSLTCRIYYLPDGRVSPVPSRQQIEEAVR
jgi:hypothetical protein